MAKILYKKQMSPAVFMMRLEAPLIASERKAGQFIILQTNKDLGERIPLTIADADTKEGSITIIFQTVGKTTKELSTFNIGDDVPVLVGPLGSPTHIEKFGKVVCVCGGVGIAPMYPIVKALKEAGNQVTVIMGARNESLFLMREEMTRLADKIILMTDDGSCGRQGVVTVPLKELCEDPNEKPDMVIAIGPPIMMKFCALTTKPYGVKTIVSLNSIMVDGTGMCGGCRVSIGGKTKFVCVDGPEFDGHEVDWDNMMQRMSAYKPEEQEAVHKFGEKDGHNCNIDKMFNEKKPEGK
ncbi:MAG: sulfide/dihydroorotate dehydrogenase-like FAD/NAD-binding protein [Fibrobacteraceae bacterium]|nr:sulfide/dihydroorotate dehydrogenase-like FAD/NAD-binding protein [Fibrobacteraceae bacterium]